jgi:hypothetical protein
VRGFRRRWSVAVPSLALVLFCSAARADETQPTARDKFRQATEAHERGDFRGAAELFEEAHRLAPAAGAKFNAGIAWDESGNASRAADDYETALEMGGLTEDEAKQAEERLGALRKVLGYLSVDEPAGANAEIEGTKALVPFRIHLSPGSHRIVGTRGTATTTFEVDIHAGEVKHVVLDLPLKPEPPQRTMTPPPLQPDDNRLAKEKPQTTSSAATTWGWVALGAGAVFSGVAVVLGSQTLKARDEWDASGHHDLAKHDDAVRLRTFTNVAWGGAIVAGATGTVLLLMAPTVRF